MSNPVAETPKTTPTATPATSPTHRPPEGGPRGGMAPQGAALDSSVIPNQEAVLAGLVEQLVKQNLAKAKVEDMKKVSSSKPKEIDWSKVEEKDIMSLSIPVATIEHSLDGYLDVKLADKNFVARWVHKSQHNIGMKLKTGYTFVSAEDLDPSWIPPLQFDSEGHYSFDDVTCLKIHKSIHLSKLKLNMTRAIAIQKKKEITNSHIPALSDDPAFASAQARGKMDFYDAGEVTSNL